MLCKFVTTFDTGIDDFYAHFFSYFHLFSGNVASKEDRISIAFVEAKKGTAEPFLTLHYDEWICIKKGKILFENDGGNVTANAGDTVFIKVSQY